MRIGRFLLLGLGAYAVFNSIYGAYKIGVGALPASPGNIVAALASIAFGAFIIWAVWRKPE